MFVIKDMKYNLKNIFWDYNFTEEELNDLLYKRRDSVGFLTRKKLYARMLTYMRWYDLLSIAPKEDLSEILSEDVINTIWPKTEREKLFYAKRLLFG